MSVAAEAVAMVSTVVAEAVGIAVVVAVATVIAMVVAGASVQHCRQNGPNPDSCHTSTLS